MKGSQKRNSTIKLTNLIWEKCCDDEIKIREIEIYDVDGIYETNTTI